ncbi:penicillin acylase family protein [Arthrobacter sp. GN70]|nr:penicillin acylase family protein [Arthrobacter sp. GN70]MBT8162677.1 penicillin acylase family protein [Arthrobacter sp. GN70]
MNAASDCTHGLALTRHPGRSSVPTAGPPALRVAAAHNALKPGVPRARFMGISCLAPGQSGDPRSPHYADLLSTWANGESFPLLYSRSAIEAATTHWFLVRADGK